MVASSVDGQYMALANHEVLKLYCWVETKWNLCVELSTVHPTSLSIAVRDNGDVLIASDFRTDKGKEIRVC